MVAILFLAWSLDPALSAVLCQSSCATDEALFSACGCDLISQTPEVPRSPAIRYPLS